MVWLIWQSYLFGVVIFCIIWKEPHFTRNLFDLENNCSLLVFRRPSDFLRIPELAINPLADRIVHTFFENG